MTSFLKSLSSLPYLGGGATPVSCAATRATEVRFLTHYTIAGNPKVTIFNSTYKNAPINRLSPIF